MGSTGRHESTSRVHMSESRFRLSCAYLSLCQRYLISSEHHSDTSSTSSPNSSFPTIRKPLYSIKNKSPLGPLRLPTFGFGVYTTYQSPPRLKHGHPAWLRSGSASNHDSSQRPWSLSSVKLLLDHQHNRYHVGSTISVFVYLASAKICSVLGLD